MMRAALLYSRPNHKGRSLFHSGFCFVFSNSVLVLSEKHNLGNAIIFYNIMKFRLNAMTNKMQSKCKNKM